MKIWKIKRCLNQKGHRKANGNVEKITWNMTPKKTMKHTAKKIIQAKASDKESVIK